MWISCLFLIGHISIKLSKTVRAWILTEEIINFEIIKKSKKSKSIDYRLITADQNQFTKSDGIMQSSIEMDNVWAIKSRATLR